MFNIFSKCKLAGDMYCLIRGLDGKVSDEVFRILTEQHQVILALFLLMEGYKLNTNSKAEEEHGEKERKKLSRKRHK